MWISRKEYTDLVFRAAAQDVLEKLIDGLQVRLDEKTVQLRLAQAQLQKVEQANLTMQDKLTSKSQQCDSRQMPGVTDDDIFAESPEDVDQVLDEIKKVGAFPVLARLGAGDNAANS